MASTRLPTAKPTPSSGTSRLTPSEITSLRNDARETLAKAGAALDRARAEREKAEQAKKDHATARNAAAPTRERAG